MGLANNLNKFEWDNEIPFSEEQLKRTLHAMIGESSMVSGLLNTDTNDKKWNLTCVNPESNDTFGTYSFGQINTTFSITIKKNGENNSNLHITISERQGAFITGNQAYLQSECNNFIKALTYYVENQSAVDYWYSTIKPQKEQIATQTANQPILSKGCIVAIVLFVIIGGIGLGVFIASNFL